MWISRSLRAMGWGCFKKNHSPTRVALQPLKAYSIFSNRFLDHSRLSITKAYGGEEMGGTTSNIKGHKWVKVGMAGASNMTGWGKGKEGVHWRQGMGRKAEYWWDLQNKRLGRRSWVKKIRKTLLEEVVSWHPARVFWNRHWQNSARLKPRESTCVSPCFSATNSHKKIIPLLFWKFDYQLKKICIYIKNDFTKGMTLEFKYRAPSPSPVHFIFSYHGPTLREIGRNCSSWNLFINTVSSCNH